LSKLNYKKYNDRPLDGKYNALLNYIWYYHLQNDKNW